MKRLRNATRTSFTFDQADQMTTVANMNKTATGFLTKFDYKYDPVGNRLAVKENSGDRVTWTYDATNQLLSERRNGTHAYRNTFTYDSRGNRLVNNQRGTRTTTTYDATNQIRYSQAAGGRTTYTFDANGNQQRVLDPSGNRTTTTWNFENQPTLYKLPAGTRVTMAYNADNQRVQKDASGGTTKFLWDLQNYLAEANASNTIQTVYTNEPQQFGNLISTRLGTTTVWHQFDALGSTTGLSNSAGNATSDVWIYDAWGNIVSRAGTTAVLLQWVGQLGYYFDSETGLFYVRRRQYSPPLGRWIAVDPTHFVDGLHAYHYCHNSPAIHSDVTGLVTDDDLISRHEPKPTPPFPASGCDTVGNPAYLCPYLRTSRCKGKGDRITGVPGLNSGRVGITGGPNGGYHHFCASPAPGQTVGSGGSAPCINLVVKCPGGVATFHFLAGIDNPYLTLLPYDWSKCTGIICGGDNTDMSNCLGDDVLNSARKAGIAIAGVSGGSGCGIDSNGNWVTSYQ